MENLTLEQQFHLRSFRDTIAKMSREQAIEFLAKLYKQMMLRETMYKHFLKHSWGIGEPTLSSGDPGFKQDIITGELQRFIDCGTLPDRTSTVKVSVDMPNRLYARVTAFMEEFPEVPLDEIIFRSLHTYLEKHEGE